MSYQIYRNSRSVLTLYFFFFNDTATTEIYTLSLHDALPISRTRTEGGEEAESADRTRPASPVRALCFRSEEHTSELQSLTNLVCRLLLEKKKHITRADRPELFAAH